MILQDAKNRKVEMCLVKVPSENLLLLKCGSPDYMFVGHQLTRYSFPEHSEFSKNKLKKQNGLLFIK